MLLLHFENDKSFSKRISDIAMQEDFSYERTDEFEQASRRISEKKFDLLVIDQDIHRILKNDFIKKLTSTGFVYPPVIIITAKDNLRIKKQCFNMGIMAYFKKDQFNSASFVRYLQTIKKERENINLIKTFKIAVIDDSRFSIEIIKTFFNTHGICNVDYYQKPSEFLKHAMEYNFFLIDLVMPEYNGDDVISYIREKNEEAIIILVTAYNNENILPHCLSVGANDFVLKPLDFKMFMARIKSCVSQYYLKKELLSKNEKLFNLATKDALTGLYNRIYFIETCQNKLKEINRTKQPLSFILLDIDHFKTVNDRYGHLKGDFVLKELSCVLNDNLRAADILCRWGGEEFIILLINTDVTSATNVAEKIRAIIAGHYFKEIGAITASFGVTQYRENDDDETIFKRTDNSLYLAKLTGRNKVISDEELKIIYNDKPTTIQWGPFFKSGNIHIDRDHHRLISVSNQIIHSCFSAAESKNPADLFITLGEELKNHFKREAEILAKAGYPLYLKHKENHSLLLKNADIVFRNLKDEKITFIDAAKYLIQEIAVGHIIKSDFNYYYIFGRK
ncbi:diguanylate cyclase [Pectinatus haikarae]|uniref:diguanylate cyclase n=1 Tax=Pectinatus haikarae TaxID=349096 RepID=UPI0018C7E36E|nr:diguanylate cyclase [Pectinatus haikarae]